MRCVMKKKTDLKIFVGVISKEGLVGGAASFGEWSPTNPSFGMTPTIRYILRRLQITNL